MSKAMQLIGIILLGIFTLVIIYLMSDVRSTNELDYYLLQEVTEAAMYDAVDYSYYRETGLLKVDRDMFLENFNRRFAESVDNNREYTIKIIDFNETPPKVSVEVTAPTVATVKGETALITNRVNGIIETIYDDFVYSKGQYGVANIDDEKPEIELVSSENGSYTFKITDNFVLDKYAIVESSSLVSGNFTDNDYSKITNWKRIPNYVSQYTTTETISTNSNSFWIVAVDYSGLWSALAITDNKPWISEWQYVGASRKEVIAVFRDDKGLASYTIRPVTCSNQATVSNLGVASCSGTWNYSGNGTTENIANSPTQKIISNISVEGSSYFELSVKDTAGNVSNKLYIEGKPNSPSCNAPVAVTMNNYSYGGNTDAGLYPHDSQDEVILSNIDMSKYSSITFTYSARGCQNFLHNTANITVTCGGTSQNILSFRRSSMDQVTASDRTTSLSNAQATINFSSSTGIGTCTAKITGDGSICGAGVTFSSAQLNCSTSANETSPTQSSYEATSSCTRHCDCPHGSLNGAGHCAYDESVGISVSWRDICEYTCPNGGTLDGTTCIVN